MTAKIPRILHLPVPLVLTAASALAQEPPAPTAYEAAQMANVSFTSTKEFTLSITVMVFGLLVLALLGLFQRSLGSGELLFKAIAMVITLTLAVVALFSGYTDTQITPVIGLLGTAIGYALGRNEREKAAGG